jgi:restriction system protein
MLVAGGYEEEGWRVELTKQSGDGGVDVIATRDDIGTIRVIDQVKLYAPHRVVDAEAVRALYGVLAKDLGASKGVITTTSCFAPGIAKEFEQLIPGRIQLRDGVDLRKWLLKDKA